MLYFIIVCTMSLHENIIDRAGLDQIMMKRGYKIIFVHLKKYSKRIFLYLARVVSHYHRLRAFCLLVLNQFPTIKAKLRTVIQKDNIAIPYYPIDKQVLQRLLKGQNQFSLSDEWIDNPLTYGHDSQWDIECIEDSDPQQRAVAISYNHEVIQCRRYLELMAKIHTRDI